MDVRESVSDADERWPIETDRPLLVLPELTERLAVDSREAPIVASVSELAAENEVGTRERVGYMVDDFIRLDELRVFDDTIALRTYVARIETTDFMNTVTLDQREEERDPEESEPSED